MVNKKKQLSGFTLKPITKINNSDVKKDLDIDKAADAIHSDENISIEQSINTKVKQPPVANFERPRGSKHKKQGVVNVQVPTPKDLYIKIKGLIIDREDIKGMKYLYLDAIEYYLKNKLYDKKN